MSKTKRILFGIAACAPLTYKFLLLGLSVFGMASGTEIFAWIGWPGGLVLLPWVIVMMIVAIIHAVKAGPDEDRRMWILGLIFVPTFILPFYWYYRVWGPAQAEQSD